MSVPHMSVVQQRANRAGQVIALALLAGLAMVPLAPVFDDPRYWLAVGGGVLVGTAVAVFATRLRADSLLVAGLALVGYFLFGGLFALRDSTIAGVLPSIATVRDLALNVVFGWQQLLTISVPVSGFDHLFGMPYLVALAGSVLAVSLALRTSSPGLPLIPPAVQLVFAIAFGESQGLLPGLVGGAFAALGLGWAAWRRSGRRAGSLLSAGDEVRRAAVRTAALGTAILLATGGAATVAATSLGASWDRRVLREEIIPPLDLHDFASPLMSFRKYVVDGEKTDKEVLFRVTGLPRGASIRLATMDLYDGVVYQVSGAGGAGSGVFQRVGRSLPASSAPGDQVTARVQIEGLTGVWLPDAGYPSAIDFQGSRAAELRSGLNYNAATGTVLQTASLKPGDSYTFKASVAAQPSDDQLADATLSNVTVPAPTMTPDSVQTILDEALPDVAPPAAQVRAIEKYLTEKGFFSNGQDKDGVPSLPGHGYRRLTDMLDKTQLVGDDEQYAVVMALMLAKIGVPARVVMGFKPDAADPGSEIAVTGKDIRAWVEVPFDGFGWVAYYPHPTNPPDKQMLQSRDKPRPQVPQPPLPPQEPAELPPQPPDAQTGDENRGQDLAWLWLTLRIGGISLGALAVVFGPGLLMLAAKARRRGRRRGAAAVPDRMSGGWDEVIDTAADVGVRVAPAGTRREHAVELAGRYPDLQLTSLAARADVAVFGAAEPSADLAAAYWDDVDTARNRIAQQTRWPQRVRRFFAPASVVRHRPKWWRWR